MQALPTAALAPTSTTDRGKAPTNAAARWIHGSLVNVRQTPQPGAAVLVQWPTNTPVTLVRQHEAFCEIEGPKGQRGFVACALLGDRPLSLKDLPDLNKGDGTLNVDVLARAFWITPSLQRWIDYGVRLNTAMLNADQLKQQATTRKPIRWRAPEFEAMKQLMSSGVVPALEHQIHWVPVEPPPDRYWGWTEIAWVQALLEQKLLPPAKPSLFRAPGDVLVAADASIDALAAMTGKQMQVRVLRGPVYSGGNLEHGVDGFWDVGAVRTQLAQPVYLHAVSAKGLLGAYSRDSEQLEVGGRFGEQECSWGFPNYAAEAKAIPGYTKVTNPIASFYVPRPLPARNVKVTSRALPVGPRDVRWVLREVDLDSDGSADLVVWSEQGGQAEYSHHVRAYFVNLDGTWWLAGYDQESKCL